MVYSGSFLEVSELETNVFQFNQNIQEIQLICFCFCFNKLQ